MNDWTPQRLLETSGAFWHGCALQAGVRLDIFTQLATAPMAADALAEQLNCDHRGMAMLLRALAAMGLLVKEVEVYRCPEIVGYWLDRNSDQYLGHIIGHHQHLVESWNRLPEAVRSGSPQRQRSSYSEGEWQQDFLLGMHNLSSVTAPKLVPLIDVEGAQSLLDVGGGPGTWAINFCRHYPQLQATVFDLPGSRPFAEGNIRSAGMSERISFAGGDFLSDPLGSGYELVWLSQVLHGEGPDNAAKLVHRAAAALAHGGQLLVHEFILNNRDQGPVFAALFSLNMLLGTETGQSYTEEQIDNMCRAAGLEGVRRLELPGHVNSGIISARKVRD